MRSQEQPQPEPRQAQAARIVEQLDRAAALALEQQMARDDQPAYAQCARHAFAVMGWNCVGAISRRQAFEGGQEVVGERARQTARYAEPVADERSCYIPDGPALCNAKPDIQILPVLLALGKADAAIAQDAQRQDRRAGAKENPVGPDLEKP